MDKLIEGLIEVNAVQFGDFTLASGKKSPIYVDLRMLQSKASVLREAAKHYAKLLKNLKFERVAAIPYAGMPIGTAVALEVDAPFIYPRKEVKDHGRGKIVEGEFNKGETAIVIEDVITSGGSIIEGADKLREAGLIVNDAVVLLDRLAGGEDNLSKQNIKLHSVMKITDLMDILFKKGKISKEKYAEIMDFIKGK